MGKRVLTLGRPLMAHVGTVFGSTQARNAVSRQSITGLRLLGIGVFAVIMPPAEAEETPPNAAEETIAVFKNLSLEELMQVEVTSVSRRPERQAEVASSIQVVRGEDIRRSGATSIPQALRLASNLHVARVDSRQWAISARGFNSTTGNKMLVMIDGRTVYTPLFSGVFWDAQDVFLPDVDRIEVVSGPGATLWGANAVNGVISVVSKAARDTQGAYVEGGGGAEIPGFAGARYGGALSPDLHYRVYGKHITRDDSALPNGDDALDRWQMTQGGFRTDWDASPTTVLTLQGDTYGGTVETPTEDLGLSGGNVLGRWSQGLAEDSSLQLQVYADRTYRDIPDSIGETLDTYDIDFQHHCRPLARHDVTWGLGYRLLVDDIDNPPNIAFLPAEVTRDLFTGFLQDEIALIHDRLALTLGSKVEHNDYTGLEIQPSARVVLRPADQHTLWASIARAVRTPSRADTELFIPRDPPHAIQGGGDDFQSESVWAYELGYRVQPDEWLSLSLALFYNDYDDLRSVEQANPPAPAPLVIANGFAGESYGAELSADAQIAPWWRMHAGYTTIRTDIRNRPGSTDPSGGSVEARDPEHIVTARAAFDLGRRVELDLTPRYVGQIDNQDVPAYVELGVRLGWTPRPDYELSVVGQNLLHDQHPEFGAPATRREIERSVYGKLVCRF